jgi:hypothetical protein
VTLAEFEVIEWLAVIWFAVSLAVTLKPVYGAALGVAVTFAEEHVSVLVLCEQVTKLAGKLFRVKLYPPSPLPLVTV